MSGVREIVAAPTRPGSTGSWAPGRARISAASTRRWAEARSCSCAAPIWRWAETILEVCPDLAGAAAVLAVGDIHLENFGTWRDGDGRLVWGVNDFDEAARMPYALDLVRPGGQRGAARAQSRSGHAGGGDLPCRSWRATPGAAARRRRSCSTATGPGCASCWWSPTGSAPSSGARSRRPSMRRRRRAIGARSPRPCREPRLKMRTARRDRGHRQPRVGRAGSAWPIGKARRSCARSKACCRPAWELARGAQRGASSAARSSPADRFRANDPWYRVEGNMLPAPALPQQPQDRGGEGGRRRCSRPTCCAPWDSSSPTCIWAPAIRAPPSCATSPAAGRLAAGRRQARGRRRRPRVRGVEGWLSPDRGVAATGMVQVNKAARLG